MFGVQNLALYKNGYFYTMLPVGGSPVGVPGKNARKGKQPLFVQIRHL